MSSQSDKEREAVIRSHVTISPSASVGGYVAGRDIIFHFADQLQSRIDELITLLQDRATKIERDLKDHYDVIEVQQFLNEFRRLHQENIAALRKGYVLRSHEIVKEIHRLSVHLECSEFVKKLSPRPGVDYAMGARAGQEGPLICGYLAGDVKRKSAAYPEDFDLLRHRSGGQIDLAASYLAIVLPSKFSLRDAVLMCGKCNHPLESVDVGDDKLRKRLEQFREEEGGIATRVCWCGQCEEYPIWFYYGTHKGWKRFGSLP